MTVPSRTLGRRIQAAVIAVIAVILLAGLGWWWRVHSQQQAEQRRRACETRNAQGALANAYQGRPDWAFQAEDCR